VKHYSAVALGLILVLAITASALAATKPVWQAKKAAEGITVDGNLSEDTWLAAAPVALFDDDPVVKALGTVWDTVAASAVVRLAWDEDNFYMGAVVHDDSVNTSKSLFYQKDCICPFFYSKADSVHHKFFAVPSDPAVVYSGVLNASASENDKVTAAARKTDNGYVMELAIPWSELAGMEPAPGSKIRFTLLLIDPTDSSWGQYMLVGNGDDSANFAYLEFAE